MIAQEQELKPQKKGNQYHYKWINCTNQTENCFLSVSGKCCCGCTTQPKE